jgi:hypothetical protein
MRCCCPAPALRRTTRPPHMSGTGPPSRRRATTICCASSSRSRRREQTGSIVRRRASGRRRQVRRKCAARSGRRGPAACGRSSCPRPLARCVYSAVRHDPASAVAECAGSLRLPSPWTGRIDPPSLVSVVAVPLLPDGLDVRPLRAGDLATVADLLPTERLSSGTSSTHSTGGGRVRMTTPCTLEFDPMWLDPDPAQPFRDLTEAL